MSIASPSPLDSLSQDLVLHILDSRDDAPGGYSMLQLQEVVRLGACNRAQVLYPWTQLRIKAEAEAAEAKRAAAKRAAAERRDAEGERTGERPRKRSRLPISPVRGG